MVTKLRYLAEGHADELRSIKLRPARADRASQSAQTGPTSEELVNPTVPPMP